MDREALFTGALLLHGHPPNDATSLAMTNYQLSLVDYFMDCGVAEMWINRSRRDFLNRFFMWYYEQERKFA